MRAVIRVAAALILTAGTGATIALLGWGMGGILGGVFADYFGRRRTLLVRSCSIRCSPP